jgi:hypothetical protein
MRGRPEREQGTPRTGPFRRVVEAEVSERLESWLAPSQRREIELQLTGPPQRATSDDQGRFVFSRVPPGAARLVVAAPETGPGSTGRLVMTPQLVL